MKTDECGRCLRYRGYLRCDAFPRGIPGPIMDGEHSHREEYPGDQGIRFDPAFDGDHPLPIDNALIQHVNDVVEKEDVAYRRVRDVLKRKGYKEVDFEEGGPLYGYSTNQLIDLAKTKS